MPAITDLPIWTPEGFEIRTQSSVDTTPVTYTYGGLMNAFLFRNDGSANCTLTINGLARTVASGQIVKGNDFSSFTVVASSGSISWTMRAFHESSYVTTSQANSYTVTIATSGTTSDAITLSGNSLVGLLIPSTWDGGNITIQGCDTLGGTYVDIYDSAGTIATVTVGGVSRIVGLAGSIMQCVANVPFIRLKSASAVAANRSIVVLTKG